MPRKKYETNLQKEGKLLLRLLDQPAHMIQVWSLRRYSSSSEPSAAMLTTQI